MLEDKPLEVIECDSPMAMATALQYNLVKSPSVMSWVNVSPPVSPAKVPGQLTPPVLEASTTAGISGSDSVAEDVHRPSNTNTNAHLVAGLEVPESATSLHIPVDISSTVNQLLQLLQQQVAAVQNEATAQHMLAKLRSMWSTVQGTDASNAGPFFLFKDGPATQAAKMGRPLFLEDFDLPSQAATERLNSLLESEPTFAVNEDITAHAISGAQAAVVKLPSGFQVFASVHKDKPGQLRSISAATRSRFTEIVVTEYEEEDVQNMITAKLQPWLGNVPAAQVTAQLVAIHRLQQHVRQRSLSADVRQLFRWVDFICTHSNEVSLEYRIMLGARFLFFDDQHSTLQSDVIKAYPDIFSHTGPAPAWVGSMFRSPNDADMGRVADADVAPFTLTAQGNIQLKYSGVIAPLQQPADMQTVLNRYFCATTQTVVTNFARVFAALSAKSPLLLEGPPGIGKTAIVTQVYFFHDAAACVSTTHPCFFLASCSAPCLCHKPISSQHEDWAVCIAGLSSSACGAISTLRHMPCAPFLCSRVCMRNTDSIWVICTTLTRSM